MKHRALFLTIILFLGIVSLLFATPVPTTRASSVIAWNPNVTCNALVTTFQNVTGSSGSLSGSPWQVNSANTGGVPDKRALSPPCTIKNINGQTVSTLVQINSIYIQSLTSEDCSSSYAAVNGGGPYPPPGTFCDDTGGIQPISGSGSIHIEFDRDWLAKGYCGSGHSPCDDSLMKNYFSSGSISIDVQGFAFWDNGSSTNGGHWELHPFTAWKLSSSPAPLSASFTFAPSNPSTNTSVTFTATASGGTAPYTFSWNFGDGSTGSGSSTTHSYSKGGTYTVSLTVKDSSSPTPNTQTVTQSLTVSSSTATFTVGVSGPFSGLVGSSLTFSATPSGGTSPYSFSWTATGGSPSTGTGSTFTTTYNAQGTYTVSVTATDANAKTATSSISTIINTSSSNQSTLTFQGFDWDGGGEHTLTMNGRTLASLPTSDSPQNANIYVTFSVNTTGFLVQGTNKLLFTHANWDCSVVDSVKNLQVTAGATLVYTNSTVLPLSCTQSITYTFTIGAPPPDFSLVPGTTSLNTPVGSSGTVTLTLSSLNAFSGTVSLSLTSTSGLTASLNPTSLTLASEGTGSSTLTANSGTVGNYTVTVTGTSGSLSHSTAVIFRVSDFTVSASPTSVALAVGGTGSSTITVSSVNGFSGSVSLFSTVSPSSGLTCGLTPTGLSGSGTSTLSCNASSSGAFTVAVMGSSGSLSHSISASFNVASTDFSVTASPTSVNMNSGATGTSTITIAPINGFTGTVTLSSSVTSSGLTCSLSLTSVVLGGSQTSSLSCSGQTGTYTVTVTGTSSSISHSATITYNVLGPDFTIAASPTSVTGLAGTTGSSTITVAPVNGFTGTVSLASSSTPAGLSCNLTPNSLVLGGSQSSLLACGGNAGVYSVTVTGSSGALFHAASVTFALQDFTVTSSSNIVLAPGISSSTIVTVSSLNGFSGTVSLQASASNGLSAAVNPANVTFTGGTATSTLTLSPSAIGNYTVAVTGTSGSISHTTSIAVAVTDFSIASNPSSLSLPAGSTVTSLITLTSLNGFSGTVSLSATVSPTGPRLSLSTTSLTLKPGGSGTSTLSVRALKKLPVGTYTITVTATSGSWTHTITVQLTVT